MVIFGTIHCYFCLIIAVLLTWASLGSNAVPTICQLKNKNGDGELSFTREAPTPQYASKMRYHALQCESANFCSIRWYLNDRALEESGLGAITSSLTNYELSEMNQTLTFKSTDCDADGVYRCDVSDGARTISREVTLIVTEPIWGERPISLNSLSCTDQTAVLGGNASFECHFAYKTDKGLLQCDQWYKLNETDNKFRLVDFFPIPGTEIERGFANLNLTSECSTSNEMFHTATTWMNITNVTEDALGQYLIVCKIVEYDTAINLTLSLMIMEEEQIVADPTTIATTALLLVAVFVICIMVWRRHRIDLQLWFRDHLGTMEKDHEDENKLYDAYVVSSLAGEDRTFIYDILCPSLEDRYRLFIRERDVDYGTTLAEEVRRAIEASRRCIVVLSPDVCRPQTSSQSTTLSSSSSPYTSTSAHGTDSTSEEFSHQNLVLFELKLALDSMRNHRKMIVPIVYRDPPLLTNTTDSDAPCNSVVNTSVAHSNALSVHTSTAGRSDPDDSIAKMITYVMSNLDSLCWKQKGKSRLDPWALKSLRLRLPTKEGSIRSSLRHASETLKSSTSKSIHLPSPSSSSASISSLTLPHATSLKMKTVSTIERSSVDSPSTSVALSHAPSSPSSMLSSPSKPASLKSQISSSSASSMSTGSSSTLPHSLVSPPSSLSLPPSSPMSVSSPSSSSVSSPHHASIETDTVNDLPQEFNLDAHASAKSTLSNVSIWLGNLMAMPRIRWSRPVPYLIDNESLADVL